VPESRTPLKFCRFVSNDGERLRCIFLWLTVEITTILQNGLRKMVKEKGLERFAFRLSEVVDGLVRRVDLDTYGTFRAIMLTEGKEFEESLSDAAPEEQPEIQGLATKFFEVR
jgi:hypothetical protein